MNIVYHQHGHFVFLREGLSQLGHAVYPIHFIEGEPFDDQVSRICTNADIVFFEMYGPFRLPSDIEKSKICKVAYCIDSLMYEFLLIHTLKLFDYVFVDQRSSVQTLQRYGIKSTWLPLCVPDDNFRNETKKLYDITFVGSVSGDRVKRGNLLRYIGRRFDLNYVNNVDLDTMQTIFSQSKIVLNENHFNGVNLRVFQALASGSLLLTEKESDGLSTIFTEEKHLVTYTRDNILDKIDRYISNDSYKEIAFNGYSECRKKHTSLERARECVRIIEEGYMRNPKRSENESLLAQAEAIYARALRFGGDIRWSIDLAKKAAAQQGELSGQSYTLLGSLLYTCGRHDQAIRFLYTGFSLGERNISLSRIILYELQQKNFHKAKQLLHVFIGLFGGKCNSLIKFMENNKKLFKDDTILYFTLARLLFESGNIYHVGFYSELGLDRYLPTSSVEVAYIAWKREYNHTILDFIIQCYKLKNITIELIPLLNIAYKKGVLTRKQNDLYIHLLHESYASEDE